MLNEKELGHSQISSILSFMETEKGKNEVVVSMSEIHPEFQDVAVSNTQSLAEVSYNRICEFIQRFETHLDDAHEIGASLVSFGGVMTIHMEGMGYWGPDILTFHGVNDKGEKVQLIQNISQLNILFVAMKKLDEKPRRLQLT